MALAAVAAMLEAAIVGGLGSSYSVFASSTANGANSFQAAATFPPSATLFSVGANANGQLGLGGTSIQYTPAQVGVAQWTQVGGGARHACGVHSDGSLFCWGSNATGQLGIGNNNDQHSPVAPSTSANFSMAVGGDDFSCGIRTDHSLWCWGGNGNGQLGLGDTTARLAPVQVGTASWSTVTAGLFHACGIQTNGTLWCWGANGSGQIGQGNTTTGSYPSPIQVGTGTTWTSVGAGYLSACATKSDGTLWCWGDNTHGQLGLGNTTPMSSPTQVAGSTWKTVSTGQYHACATKNDGTLWCWGENSNGQVGIGSTATPKMSPQQVTTVTNWKAISLGYQHTCATRADKTAWCWGNNTNGQLGLNNTTQMTYPSQVPFKTVEAISAGSQSNSTYIITSEAGIETNLAVGLAVASSGNLSGYPAISAIDNDPISSYWQSTSGFPQWLRVKFGASTSIGRVVIATPEVSGWSSFTETISVEGSPDTNTWTTVVPSTTYTFDPASGDMVTVTFAPQSFLYWRLNVTATSNGSNAGQISEFQLYAS